MLLSKEQDRESITLNKFMHVSREKISAFHSNFIALFVLEIRITRNRLIKLTHVVEKYFSKIRYQNIQISGSKFKKMTVIFYNSHIHSKHEYKYCKLLLNISFIQRNRFRLAKFINDNRLTKMCLGI